MPEDEMIQRGEVQERLTPYLAERLPLRGLFRPEFGPAASRADFERLFGELQFANLIEVRRRFAENILGELQVLRETLDNILSLIQEEDRLVSGLPNDAVQLTTGTIVPLVDRDASRASSPVLIQDRGSLYPLQLTLDTLECASNTYAVPCTSTS